MRKGNIVATIRRMEDKGLRVRFLIDLRIHRVIRQFRSASTYMTNDCLLAYFVLRYIRGDPKM